MFCRIFLSLKNYHRINSDRNYTALLFSSFPCNSQIIIFETFQETMQTENSIESPAISTGVTTSDANSRLPRKEQFLWKLFSISLNEFEKFLKIEKHTWKSSLAIPPDVEEKDKNNSTRPRSSPRRGTIRKKRFEVFTFQTQRKTFW